MSTITARRATALVLRTNSTTWKALLHTGNGRPPEKETFDHDTQAQAWCETSLDRVLDWEYRDYGWVGYSP